MLTTQGQVGNFRSLQEVNPVDYKYHSSRSDIEFMDDDSTFFLLALILLCVLPVSNWWVGGILVFPGGKVFQKPEPFEQNMTYFLFLKIKSLAI